MHASGERWRLGRRPGLDGLRGVAVLLVISAHTLSWAPANAGNVGVTVFFTLSGFLITALLLETRDRNGRISLAAFYERRARRLLPALVAVLAAVLAVASVVPGFTTRRMIVGTVLYANNWITIGDPNADMNALGHTWSLAIEEQFYLLWPIVVIIALQRGARAIWSVTLLGITASATASLVEWSPMGWIRVYCGSDTRAYQLLAGAVVALVLRHGYRSRHRTSLAMASATGLCAAALMTGWWAIVGGPMITAACTATFIYAVTEGRPSEQQRSIPVLGWVGRRSYGLYLWHLPVTQLFHWHSAIPWQTSAPVIICVSFVLAALSWRYVEAPLLRARSERSGGAAVPSLEVAEVR